MVMFQIFQDVLKKSQMFSWMKNHDYHVSMQLLPFVFPKLLPTNIHKALPDKYCLLISLITFIINN